MSHFDKLCSQAYTRMCQGCLTTSVLGTQGSSLGTGGSGGVLAGPPRKEPALQTNVVPFDDLTDEETTELALLSRIPLFAGDSRKQMYLGYRSCGFTITESCQLAEVELSTVQGWRSHDAEFKDYERTKLRELQATAGGDILKLEFTRNMMLFLRKDAGIIRRSLSNTPGDFLNEDEVDYLKLIRKHYTAGELGNLEKALSPDKGRSKTVIKLTWGGQSGTPGIEVETEVEGQFEELD